MIIYWDTLEKNAGDISTIPAYIASLYFGPALYPAVKSKALGTGASGDLPLPGNLGVYHVCEKTAGWGVLVDGFHVKDGCPINWNGWFPAEETWTYNAADSFTVPGDVRAKYPVGTALKLTNDGSDKYFYVIGSIYSDSETVVTITGGADYALADAAITVPFYSYFQAPPGFPVWFNWTPVWTGFSADPTGITARFCLVGRTCHFMVDCDASGTSNATSLVFTGPLTAVSLANAPDWGGICRYALDNGGGLPGACRWYIREGTDDIYCYTDMANGVWTSSGNKRVCLSGFYEI